LRLSVEGDPVRVSVCHCLACQRRTGSAFGFQARFPSERVHIEGRSTEFVRRADDDGDPRSFHFCPHCGATVYYVLASAPHVVAVPVGAFADPQLRAAAVLGVGVAQARMGYGPAGNTAGGDVSTDGDLGSHHVTP
jgi:hypothetical protein